MHVVFIFIYFSEHVQNLTYKNDFFRFVSDSSKASKMPKGGDTAPLRRSSRIAAADSPTPAQVSTRRSSASSDTSSSLPGKITRSKRLSLSEEATEREKTPTRTTRGMFTREGTSGTFKWNC